MDYCQSTTFKNQLCHFVVYILKGEADNKEVNKQTRCFQTVVRAKMKIKQQDRTRGRKKTTYGKLYLEHFTEHLMFGHVIIWERRIQITRTVHAKALG